MPDRTLLADFLRIYPHQPATAYWRWFETDVILRCPLPVGRGLDLGCGDGQLTQLIANRLGTWRLVGVEPDPAEIALAESKPVYERLYCTGGDAVPEPEGSFDFVFSNSVLEHIPDVRPVLREARRVLRAGGQLVATVPSGDFHACLAGPPWWWRLVWGASRADYLAEFDRRIAHFYYWSDTEWTAALRAAGFARVELRPYFERRLVQRWEWITNHTSGILYKLGGGRARPIEIQRKLGLRRPSPRGAGLLRPLLTTYLGNGNHMDPGCPPLYGCRLIQAFA